MSTVMWVVIDGCRCWYVPADNPHHMPYLDTTGNTDCRQHGSHT